MDFKQKQILIYKWKAYNYLDVYQTFLAMGFQADMIEQDLPSYDEDAEFSARLLRLLHEKEYDFVCLRAVWHPVRVLVL